MVEMKIFPLFGENISTVLSLNSGNENISAVLSINVGNENISAVL